ncbi:hypothetical protein ABI59_13195 [Acidobacteria bacterium Mor1]|nr:hypothetical protein ABI59_13195 [Acidobacteria bacterium Mor1]
MCEVSRRAVHAAVCLAFLLSSVACGVQTEPQQPEAPSASSRPVDTERLAQRIDETVERIMGERNLPGAAVVVVQRGRTIFSRGYGMADVEAGRVVDVDRTLFRIGSITKALTALAVTRLVDQGRLNFDDDVSTLIDGLELQGSFDEPVRVRHLVTHTAAFDQIGVGRQLGGFEYPLPTRQAARPPLAEFLRGNLRRTDEPGRFMRYDTYGIVLAGLLLEQVTGKTYAQAMNELVFEPAGMSRSSVEVTPELEPDLALGYGFDDGNFEPQHYEVYLTTPASSIDATPADMGRLLEALTSGGANEHGRLLSAEAARAVGRPQFRPHPEFPGITHGFWERPLGRRADGSAGFSVEHGGGMLGFTSRLALLPELEAGFFVTTNRDWEAGGGDVEITGAVGDIIVEELLGALEDAPLPRPGQNDADLQEYAGDYVNGVYCRTCSEEEFQMGGWPMRRPQSVEVDGQALVFGEARYLAAGNDVFVREDGLQRISFGRGGNRQVAFLVESDGPVTLEKIR